MPDFIFGSYGERRRFALFPWERHGPEHDIAMDALRRRVKARLTARIAARRAREEYLGRS